MSDTDKEKINALLREAASIIRSKADSEIPALLGDGIVSEFLEAMAPRKSDTGQTIYDYLLANKHRLQLVALLRYAIQQNYSMSGIVNGRPCFASPDIRQWFDDGVMFLQGKERFAGLLGLYQNGQVKFPVVRQDIRGGEDVGPDDLLFLTIDEFRQLESKEAIPASPGDLDLVLEELGRMLGEREENEAKYQSFFTNNPWVFGMQYSKIDSHTAFDDENIPDFTGVRARDNTRDIIEIKQPFMPLFRQDGSFRAEFHRAWQQAEDYLDFALSDTDFLYKRKGLHFDNPHCNLLLGYDLSPNQRAALRRKEKMNPRITILTYNDLVALSKNTVQRIKMLKGWDQESTRKDSN